MATNITIIMTMTAMNTPIMNTLSIMMKGRATSSIRQAIITTSSTGACRK